jgi:hypothetical protein
MSKLIPPKDRPAIKTPQELVHIKHRITLLQYKYWVLMLRAYRKVYEEGGVSLRDDEYCYLPMKLLAEDIGYEPKTVEIEHDLEAIRKEPIIFNVLEKDGKKGKSGRGFISEWYVSSNRIGVIFPPLIRQAIENLDSGEAIFQLLNWSIFNSFTGKYEAVLYKLCKDYIGIGRTPYMPLDEFRGYMGIKDGEYADFKRLNQWVISNPIKRINESEVSDICIAAEFKREARKIIGLWFTVKPKKQTVMDFGDDPAFRLAKTSIPLAKQKEYLKEKGAALVEFSIQRANDYGEAEERLGKEVNFGALYRKAIEEEWGKDYQTKKARDATKLAIQKKKKLSEEAEAQQKQVEELRNLFARMSVTETLKVMSLETKQKYAQKYLQEAGKGSDAGYNPDKAEFTNKIENIKFSAWLRKEVSPTFDSTAFAAWVKAEKGIDPKSLGL